MPSLPSFSLRKRGIAIVGSVAAVGLAATAAVALPGNGASSAVADPNAKAAVASASAQASQEAAAKAAAAKAAAEQKAAAEAKAAAAKKAADEKAAADKAAAHKAAAEKAAADQAAAQRAAQQAANRSQQRQPVQQQAPAAPSGSPQEIAAQIVPADQLASFDQIISHESGWNVTATNPSSGAYGLAQALPGSKMASAGADWQTNPATQIRWALSYMDSTYGSPNAAWAFWQAHNWY
ncbi:lytic transglycosylase domain-containing protein [Streptacidiphilus pinicola]|uniref:Lytic transglycosylase domain-containing protein n=1 Tax=Streptacidiphilus pinicola TaxID=2219663 RepID=A0A2X0J8N2_9ACTN|nr:lytic transglycosylase domain-containing protein [Streptacidiphilus pinicola]RAG86646.1 lytic transglycosylase domain-containing protein [Streptacidiphilus pinicola]